MTTAIILAAGKSERMGNGADKAFITLGSKPVIAWSLLAFEHCREIDDIILVVRKEQLFAAKALKQMFGIAKLSKIIAGGARRQDSVANALKELDPDARVVVIHDGARPCVTPETITLVTAEAKKSGAAIVGRKMIDTVKSVEKGNVISETVDRAKLWQVQTPQAFSASLIRRAYAALAKKKGEVTDDSAAVEQLGENVKICECNTTNIKITNVEDLQVASKILM